MFTIPSPQTDPSPIATVASLWTESISQLSHRCTLFVLWPFLTWKKSESEPFCLIRHYFEFCIRYTHPSVFQHYLTFVLVTRGRKAPESRFLLIISRFFLIISRFLHFISRFFLISRFSLLSQGFSLLSQGFPYYLKVSPYYLKVSPYYLKVFPYYLKVFPYYLKVFPYYLKVFPYYLKVSCHVHSLPWCDHGVLACNCTCMVKNLCTKQGKTGNVMQSRISSKSHI